MYIDVYLDTTPLWNREDDEIIYYYADNICTIDVPESILRGWYEGPDGFEEWYENEYTLDETDGLYDYCVRKGYKPEILYEKEWKQYLKDIKEAHA